MAGLVVGLVFARLLYLGHPTVQWMAGWFWPVRHKPLDASIVAALLFATSVVSYLLTRPFAAARPALPIVLCGLLGLGLQFGLALSEGRGLMAIADRTIRSGHSEFARTASQQPSIVRMVRDYEAFVSGPHPFARSKPPGQMAFYQLLTNVAEPFDALDRVLPYRGDNTRHRRFVALATLLFPLLSMLPLVPLAFLARRFLPRSVVHVPLLLFVLNPSIELVTMHLDQVLYPVFAVGTTALVVLAADATSQRRAAAWATAAATSAFVALFTTFSMLPAFVLALAFGLLALREGPTGRARRLRAGVIAGTVLVVSAVLFTAAFVGFRYDPIVALVRTLENHREWTGWRDSSWWSAFQSSLTEYAYWIGPPVAALMVGDALRAGRDAWTRVRRRAVPAASGSVALAVAVVLVLTAALGTTGSEIARLWAFFVPFSCLGAAGAVPRAGSVQRVTRTLIAFEFGWLVLFKSMQDFR